MSIATRNTETNIPYDNNHFFIHVEVTATGKNTTNWYKLVTESPQIKEYCIDTESKQVIVTHREVMMYRNTEGTLYVELKLYFVETLWDYNVTRVQRQHYARVKPPGVTYEKFPRKTITFDFTTDESAALPVETPVPREVVNPTHVDIVEYHYYYSTEQDTDAEKLAKAINDYLTENTNSYVVSCWHGTREDTSKGKQRIAFIMFQTK